MKTKTVLPIFFATDDGYAPTLGVALTSLLVHLSPEYDARIHVLTTGLSPKHVEALSEIASGKATLTFVDVKEKVAPLAKHLALRDYFTSATYFRLFISELFPEYDKALYLDCDIVLNCDVATLFETQLGNNLVAAVPEDVMARYDVFGRYVEAVLDIPRAEYFNAGVLVMNLEAFRRERILERFIDLLSRRRYVVTQDEDYLNALCRGAVCFLEDGWNTSPLSEEGARIPALIHYKLGRKPWHYRTINFASYFWHYAEMTPYAEALKDELARYSAEDAYREQQAFERLMQLAEREIRAEARRHAPASRTRATAV